MVVVLLLATLLAYMYWPTDPVKIIISRETTYIDGPLNADGTVNYVAYLNQKYSDGVTAENNAAPLLLRACGPELLADGVRGEALSILGLPDDFFDSDKHFIMWDNRTHPAKARTTTPTESGEGPEPNEEDGEDGPSLKEVREMLLAGQVHPEFEAWLAENAGALDLLRQASKKDRFYLPFLSTSTPPTIFDAMVPYFIQLNSAVESLTLRALLKASRGNLAGAWEDVLVAHRLARLIDQSPSLVGRLVATRFEDRASKAGIVLATRYPLPAELAWTVLRRLAALDPLGDVVDSIDECERFFALDVVMMLARGKSLKDIMLRGPGQTVSKAALDLDWNQMLVDMTSWYDRMVKPPRIPSPQARRQANMAFEAEVKKTANRVGTASGGLKLLLLRFGGRPCRSARTSVVTDMLVAILIPSFGQVVTLADRTKTSREIETLAVALACYHVENGRWPGELKELCPSLLKAIPTDRFSGKPLVYRPSKDGYLLYSVGMNLRDDGGQWGPRSSGTSATGRKDDIVAEVKPAGAASQPAASQP